MTGRQAPVPAALLSRRDLASLFNSQAKCCPRSSGHTSSGSAAKSARAARGSRAQAGRVARPRGLVRHQLVAVQVTGKDARTVRATVLVVHRAEAALFQVPASHSTTNVEARGLKRYACAT